MIPNRKPNDGNGQFTFNTTGGSGDNLVDFMLGFPSNFAQGNPEAENWRYTYWGLYAQDNIKLLPNLTFNVGVRWEPYLPSTDIMHRGSHFDYAAFVAGTHSTVYPNAPAGLQYCGDPGVPCAFAQHKLAQFSPRIGLIWDPTKKGNMTVRASYGLFYDSPELYYFDIPPDLELHHEIFGSILDRTEMTPFLLLPAKDYAAALASTATPTRSH